MNRLQRPSLLVFSDDWGRHPSSCQHLIRHLLPKYQVCWVNTIGMRKPAFDRVTLLRAMGKLHEWFVPKPQSPAAQENPCVLNPRMWPWFSRKHDRWINRNLLMRKIAPRLERSGRPWIAVSTIPIIADLVGRLPVARWVYYCVDDFSKWPGLDQSAIGELEGRFVRDSDVLIASSTKLQERLASLGRASELLTHGVDLEHWSAKLAIEGATRLEGMELPIVLFWGSIDWQVNLDFLRRLAADLDRGTIALVGPRLDHDPALFSIPRVVHVQKVPYAELPALARKADVLIMPYGDGPGLQESQPLKLKEYLASGKPAVVCDLPANRVWQEALDVVRTAEEFSRLVRTRLQTGLPASQAGARRSLDRETWALKAEAFEKLALSPEI